MGLFFLTFTLMTAQDVPVMSYNIRYNNPDDGESAWPHRKEHVAHLLQSNGVAVAGLQEVLQDQIEDLEVLLPTYDWIGVGRDDGVSGGEFSPIFYVRDQFDVMEKGTFWLSETPEVPGSKSWDAAITRIVTYSHFRHRNSGITFWFFNTHFDHRGEDARRESARLLMARIATMAEDASVVVAGDFNALPEAEVYRTMTSGRLVDARLASVTVPLGPVGTFSGFRVRTEEPSRRIDYVFVDRSFSVRGYRVLADHAEGRYPSDHLPVLASVRFAEQ